MHLLCTWGYLAGDIDRRAPQSYYDNLLAIERAWTAVEVTVHELALEGIPPLEFRDRRLGKVTSAHKHRVKGELIGTIFAFLLDPYRP